ncbi:ABC transporter permease [Ancylobacter sp. A5.8]|uniref:ABC transporter permease n=1 Tax=Ancylobacter gelatini TaxID=2919920 RepID=UPI001F4F0AAF|nr:ABC transporter permease [Ancylobacter gelatini]MCJ8144519.1 ABC transporter permease [Ancylobacter gelatini]
MFGFIAADLRRHWAGALAVVLIIAFATALGVVVTLQERALRLGSARAAQAFDLVVGAPGSETQLVLSAVFLQAAPLPLMDGEVLAGLIADPRVAYAAPVGFGDFYERQPIVGTTQALLDGLGGLASGRPFARLDEAVIGAGVALREGDAIKPQHGLAEEGGHVHTGAAYRVVGRMKPTGTPWDRALLVPIEAVWRVHGQHAEDHEGHDHEGHAHEGHNHDVGDGDTHDHAEPAPVRASEHADGDRDHDEADGLDTAIDPAAAADPHAPGVPAILVKPRTIADAYKLRQAYRSDHTLAVFPAEVLTRLYGTLGDARLVLGAVAAGAQALVGAAILLVVILHIGQRRRQIGALRAFGAPRLSVFAIVWLEAFALIAAGLVAGFGLGFVAARALSAILAGMSGVPLPVEFTGSDLSRFALLLAISALIAAVPALSAYRQSPAAALRS